MSKKDQKGLSRNLAQYGDSGFSLFLRRAFIKGMGYSDDALARPIIGVVDTYSGYNACHGNVPQIVEAVRRGVMQAGGMAIDFPTISLHESFSHPTSMYLRNLMALDTEEMIRAQPMDAVVLIGGCDKTVPAQLMAAASANVPAVQIVTGPMLTGSHRGERVGACTDCRRFWARYRAGEIDEAEIDAVNDRLVPSTGTCSVMGTASTMALMAEAMGMMLPGSAAIPAVLAERFASAERSGALAVKLAESRLAPRDIMTPAALENALTVLLATGGSTNGLIHLTAIAARLGVRVDLARLDAVARRTPVLIDLKPSGQHYMEDLHAAGGLPVLLREIRDLLHLDCRTVTGRTLGEEIDAAATWPQDIIRPRANPVYPEGGLAALFGSLAPNGAIIKQSAAAPALMEHEGRAVVFEDAEDLARRIDDENLDVRADDILVLKRIGPKGAPGMPEAGLLPIPKKLARQGVRDMVRISDGRMSGTAQGTVVLHVSPEAAAGGPLAAVQNGDRIRLSVRERRLDLLVPAEEIARRLAALPPRPVTPEQAEHEARGYRRLYLAHTTQAELGCDFDFMMPEAKGIIPQT